MIREAKARSHQMLAESSARVERIHESYEALQEAKRTFANDFRHLLRTHMDMIENMEVASARQIEASLRERLDTESIAVAREAATHEEGSIEPAESEVAQQAGVEFEEEEHAVEGAGATPQIEPEVEEPEVEPSTTSQEPDARPVAEAETVVEEDVEREEPALAEESSSETFFDREERGTSSEEGGRDNRIFRASRFLRRRE